MNLDSQSNDLRAAADELLKSVAQAFAGIPPNPRQSLHQAQLEDEGMGRKISREEYEMAARFDKKHGAWTEVRQSELEQCPNAMSYFLPKTWMFYLPAYLCAAVNAVADSAAESERQLVPDVLFALTYRHAAERPDGDRHTLARFEKLSPGQFAVVREFLVFVTRSPANDGLCADWAREALLSYWGLPIGQRPMGSRSSRFA